MVDILYFLQGNSGGGGNPNLIDTTCPTEVLQALTLFFDSYNDELLWLYPFAWAVILVRKIFGSSVDIRLVAK